jgi:hypothetical protein
MPARLAWVGPAKLDCIKFNHLAEISPLAPSIVQFLSLLKAAHNYFVFIATTRSRNA